MQRFATLLAGVALLAYRADAGKDKCPFYKDKTLCEKKSPVGKYELDSSDDEDCSCKCKWTKTTHKCKSNQTFEGAKSKKVYTGKGANKKATIKECICKDKPKPKPVSKPLIRNSEQAPVAWTSIVGEKDKCGLKGNYQGTVTLNVEEVVIRSTVHDCKMTDGMRIVPWVAIQNPAKIGEYEGFYCSVEYSGQSGSKTVSALKRDVETLTGKLDFDDWGGDNIKRTDWCKSSDKCKRQTTSSQW